MRVAIDARKLHDFGIGTYVRNLLLHLARLDRETDYVVLCQHKDCQFVKELGENFRAVTEWALPYSIAEQFRIPMNLRRERVDLFHSPHYVLPPLTPCRSIVTIHDCIHLMFPQYLHSRLAYLYAKTFLHIASRRSNRILTVSESSKKDIVKLLNVPPEKVTVIHNAIDECFRKKPDEKAIWQVRERYQLHNPFILYAGNIKPHKNLERLIDAFYRLRRNGLTHVRLLIIGDEISKYPNLRRAVHRYQLHKHVRFLGYVSDDLLAVLYRLADVFAFPSLYEGFGLPPLEAMAIGTPVVTSNVSSLPEVVGDAALLINPLDPDSIADGLRRVLTDSSLREELRIKGFAQARKYSWDRSVRHVRKIYGEVVSEI